MKPIIIGSIAMKYHALQSRSSIALDYVKNHCISDVDMLYPNMDEAINKSLINLKEELKYDYECRISNIKFDTCTYININPSNGVHYEITGPVNPSKGTSHMALFDMKDHLIELSDRIYPDLDLLYTIKMSHRYLKNSPSFLKTMRDINILRNMGAKLLEGEFYDLRIKETYDYSHPNLNVGKKDFFNSNFEYKYDHDTIHQAIAYLNTPAYTQYINSDSEVNCSSELFDECSKTIKLLGVLEESIVLALERSQIPNDFNVDPKISFLIALEKVCTSITSGWFREYAWEHYFEVVELYNQLDNGSYVDVFRRGLESGIVKPYGDVT